ncbi:MAG: AAA family ATPase [Deltaproteobacteria bacterium]|jgi:recombinational DNA repair ATPase RecF|nr:AAA family ATPase [Deltaproteobacteria bacterium]
MAILQDILDWAGTLQAWQSDAVARLLTKQVLDEGDIEDLFALLKSEHGIPDNKGRKPNTLSSVHIPAPISQQKKVSLTAIKNMKNVNAIAPGQRLEFVQSGLTIIYGDNGSGKSGYSRVLKRACRARDQAEPIHPNANHSIAEVGQAEAELELKINESNICYHWRNGQPSPPDLSAITIFDTRCARFYLENEDDFSYLPAGLDIFDSLARVFKQLKSMVEHEQKTFAVELSPFSLLAGNTEVGKLISSLSSKTTDLQIKSLSTLTADEEAKHGELGNSLRDSNPAEKAAILRSRSRRLTTISNNATSDLALVHGKSVEDLKRHSVTVVETKRAAELAVDEFQKTEKLLPGTGGDAWRHLFQAAKNFALESHLDQQFPHLDTSSNCPLCQQPLNEGAKRLERFGKFIQNDTETAAANAREHLLAARRPFDSIEFKLRIDDETFLEIEAYDQQLASDIRRLENELRRRKTLIQSAMDANSWHELGDELINPSIRITELAKKIDIQAALLENAADHGSREDMQKLFNELDARIKLKSVEASILQAAERLRYLDKLSKCMSALRTNTLTTKASELTDKVVSKELAETLNREFKALGVGALSVTLNSRADKGRSLHSLKLKLPQSRKTSEILSEGEQRAVSLASFFAEVSLGDSTAPIIFDDPVSSLDHGRRERVAKRIAQESLRRQVIVFTHDIYFLSILENEASAASTTVMTQSLGRRPQGFGVADPALPFEATSTTKRISYLRDRHQAIAKLYKNGDEQEHREQTVDAYVKLRMAWERAIEEVLLRGVVIRFRKGIETQKLSGVFVSDDDYKQITAGMAKCSNYAHDKAEAGGVAVPDPEELLLDINTLETWRSEIEKRTKEIEKNRKK